MRVLRASLLGPALMAAIACSGCALHAHEASRCAYPAEARDPSRAIQSNEEGLQHVQKEQFEQAETCFRQSMAADLFYAPAHNNLGLVLLQQKKYYEAAGEFEYAGKLAPRSAEPRANLGLLFEAVGRWPAAVDQYEQALAIEPQNYVAMGHLARTLVKAGQKDARLKELLDKLVVAGDAPDWNEWARIQLTGLNPQSR